MAVSARVVACLLLTGCAFDEIDYTGKACPCPADYSCSDGRCCKPAIAPQRFRVPWTAPNTIRWEWDPAGDPSRFGGYRLRIGSGAGPTSNMSGTLLTSAEQPELGFFFYPELDGDAPVSATLTLEREPAQPYWGQLEAVDNTGCVWSSPVLNATTAPEPLNDNTPVLIFDEDIPAEWATGPIGAQLLFEEDGRANTGSRYLEYSPPTPNADRNIQLYQLGIPLSSIGDQVGRSAFIEYAVARDAHSYWSRVVMEASAPGAAPRGARVEGIALVGDDQYHLIQVPLAALQPDEGNTTPFDGNDVLYRFLVGCSPFELGTTLRVDSVRVRW